MDDKKREIRNLECQLIYREAEGEAAKKGILGTIAGRAICFNAESHVLDDWGGNFREVIEPEAATMEFLNTQDIKINMLHHRDLTFGRAKRGVSGNARLSVDEKGVNFEVDVPNCDLGIRARALTMAGVYDGCSFEFLPKDYEVEERPDGVPLVRHKRFGAITALTIGMDPAYLQTSLSARELLKKDEDEEEEKDDKTHPEKEEEEEKDKKKPETEEEEEEDEKTAAEEKAAKEAEEREMMLQMEHRRRQRELDRMKLELLEY